MSDTKFTLTEACGKANVCEQTLRRAIKAGHLTFTKSNGRVWITDSDLKAYLTKKYVPELKTLGYLFETRELSA